MSIRATNYYVNDGVLDGDDIYTTSVGAIGNTGLAANSPKALPSQIIGLGVLSAGDTVFIDAGSYVDELLIDGINGSAGNYIVFTGVDSVKTIITGVAGTNASAPVTPRELVIQVHNSDYISLENMRLNESAGNDWVIQFYNGSANNAVKNIYIDGYYGIDIESGANTYNEISNCNVVAQYVGVRLKNGADNNHIYDCSIVINEASFFAAIEIQSASDNLIERCVISTTGNASEATVHGGKWSTGNMFYNNYLINNTAGELVLDSDFGDEIDLVHNSIYSAGSAINYEHITAGDHVIDITMESNIIYAAGGYPIILPDASDKFTLVDNNLYFSSTGDVAEIAGTGYNLAAWQAYDPDGAGVGSATNSMYGDPGYVDVANCDLSIGVTSPAYNAATNARGFGVDIFNSIRPSAGVRDVGAFELVTLPIELKFFNGECRAVDGIEFSWVTLSEVGNDYFAIESSVDGLHFQSLVEINGAGNSSVPISYVSQVDEQEGYFRLKQTDFDGNYSYSEIIRLTCVDDEITMKQHGQYLNVSGLTNHELTLQVWAMSGQLLYEIDENNTGSNIKLRLPNLSSGVYLVTVQSGSEFISDKFHF